MMRFFLAIFCVVFVSASQAFAQEPEITAKNLLDLIRKLENTQHATDRQIEKITGRFPVWQQQPECISEKSPKSLLTEVHTTRSRNGQTMGVELFVNHDLQLSPAQIRQLYGQTPEKHKQPSVGIPSVSLEYEYARKSGWTDFLFEVFEKQTVLRYVRVIYRPDENS